MLTTVSCHGLAVWICIFLRLNDGEQVFMHLLALFLSSSEKSLLPSFDQVFIGLFFFLWRRASWLYLWAFHPLSDVWFANILSQLLWCLSIQLMVSLSGQKCVHLMWSRLFLVSFVALAQSDMLLPNRRLRQMAKSTLPRSSPTRFTVSSLPFKALIHFRWCVCQV